MIKKRNNIIYRFDYQRDISFVYHKLISLPYMDTNGYGFRNIEQEEEIIFATIIKRTPTFINSFNTANGNIEKNQIFIFSEFSLMIDFRFRAIYINGSSALLAFVKTALKLAIGEDFAISATNFTAYGLYNVIKKKRIKAKVEEITIVNFSYQDGIAGRFTGRVTKHQVASSLIKQYKDDISRIALRVYIHQSDFVVQLANNGLIAVVCEEEDFRENLFYLTQIIFENHA